MSYSLPIHLIRQTLFCPRILYYQEVMGIRPHSPAWVKQGEAFHDKQIDLFKRRTLKRFELQQAQTIHGYAIESEQLQLHGVIDLLLQTTDSYYPVEIKLGVDGKPKTHQIMQLVAYAQALEETKKQTVALGFMLMGQKGKTYPIQIDQKKKDKLQQVTRKMHQIIENGSLPDSAATQQQCGQCEYLGQCNDRNF